MSHSEKKLFNSEFIIIIIAETVVLVQNDIIMETISDEIWGKVESGDTETWQEMTQIGIEKGLHCDDDMEELVNILIDQEWEGLPDG